MSDGTGVDTTIKLVITALIGFIIVALIVTQREQLVAAMADVVR